MDKLNIRIEAARLAVESGADKETFDEMAKVKGGYENVPGYVKATVK